MPRFCIRSAWIVLPLTRQCTNFATTLHPSFTVLKTITRPFHVTSFPRFLTPPGVARQSRETPLAQNSGEHPSSEYEYTVAQIARSASQAIRVAIEEGSVRDAYYVMQSMLQSPLEPGVKPPASSRRLLNPMNFGRPVPTRMSVHCLVHSLMRKGHTLEAGREIQKMIALGVRFRPRTIEANVGLLCSGPSRTLEDHISPNEETPVDPPKRLRDSTGAPRDSRASRALEKRGAELNAETRLALNLLSTARQSRHRRTERMYGWLVDACLLQGEIVVGTLLFVLLVKDWQLRQVLKSLPAEPGEGAEISNGVRAEKPSTVLSSLDLPRRTFAKQTSLDDPSFWIPYPTPSILRSILNAIDRTLFLPEPQRNAKSEALKALSILADLLDQRAIPFGELSQLIRLLSSCPSSPRRNIHLFKNGQHSHLSVYDRVHEVLLSLCQSLPSKRPNPSLRRPEMLPPLDTRSYNSLIHYALRHRLSPALAQTVIEHMTRHRDTPLQPDMVTYNIILRSASLLRKNDVVNQVLNKLRDCQANVHPAIAMVMSTNPPSMIPRASSSNELSTLPSSHFHLTLRRAAVEQMTILNSQSLGLQFDGPRRIDLYTLSSYITHLVSTGQPDVVADVIFYLLPELHVIDHPAYDSPSAQESRGQAVASHREAILRATMYGPYIFSALLNALQKAGKTGLAERVWLLAREAEQASWIPSDRPDAPAPWCLPIQAYTSMMKCYVSESKKGVRLIRGSCFFHPLSSSLYLRHERSPWAPRQTRNIYVEGWAYFYLKMQARERGYKEAEPPLRWQIAREVGYLLLKSMRKGALSVWQQLMDIRQERIQQYPQQWTAQLESLHLPVGDARFFNAVLDIFGRRPYMQARRVRVSPSWWRKKLHITRKFYGSSGSLSMTHDHNLVEIARVMAATGFSLPLGLQRALVGRVTFRTRDGQRHDDRVRPMAFSPPNQLNFRPFTVPVTKSRGLPLGRRKPLAGGRRRNPREVK